MEEEDGGIRLSKRFSDKGGEVDYKTKAGTAWSHSYLNQKPWHPLSYPNQRRKWIAEQTHATRLRRGDEVAREYAQEQEFFSQTALISKKEKEKVEMMQAVSFMYVRPPGYNAESAKAAEIADESKRLDQSNSTEGPSSLTCQGTPPPVREEKKQSRPKDVFGRPLPTEEEFKVLKNAPRLETGAPARVKPFAVEVRNVKCVRCGNYGHQSGDRECPLKDAIMPNEESRLKRDDPLTAILAHTQPSEPLKWELKQKPGISPPRGGFKPDDPNQQIVAEDIFDEYGGFLSGGNMPELLTNFSFSKHRKTKSKHKKQHASPERRRELRTQREERSTYSDDAERKPRSKMKTDNRKKKRQDCSESSQSDDDLESHRHNKKRRKNKHCYSFENPDSPEQQKQSSCQHGDRRICDAGGDSRMRKETLRDRSVFCSSENSDLVRHCRNRGKQKRSYSSDSSDPIEHHRSRHRHYHRHYY